jgi:hypothetical protein
MLPEEPPLRDPLEKPPPDPPRAFAKEMVGSPTIDNTMNAAMSFVVFKAGFLSLEFTITMACMGVSYQL